MSYVDYEYYSETYGGTIITAVEAPKALQKASDTVDVITFNRITERGIEALTGFQSDIVQHVVCALAEWQAQNADIIDNPYSSYSINGVSASWGASKCVMCVSGVLIPSGLYAQLVKTGLCYRGV